MFNNLSEAELSIVVDALDEKIFRAGETIINQGDDGFELFVVEQGKLSCMRLFPN